MKQLFMILMFLYSITGYAEIYKWIDEQGKVHYGDKAVEDSKEIDVNISNRGHLKVNESREKKRRKLLKAFDDDRQRENKEKAKKKKKKKKLKRNCAISKDRLRVYERAGSLYDIDKNGNKVVLSNKEREKTLTELRKSINKHCK